MKIKEETSFIEGMKDKRNENQRGNVFHKGNERQTKRNPKEKRTS